jgi:hypothetical protein
MLYIICICVFVVVQVFMQKRKVFDMGQKRVEAIVEENGEDALKILKKPPTSHKSKSKGAESDRKITGTGCK